MKTTFLFLSLLGAASSFGQQSVTGFIESPAMSAVNLIASNERPLDFSSIDAYAQGQLIQNYCQLEVKSNHPWILSAVLNDYSGVTNQQAEQNLIKIRVQGTQDFVSLVPGVAVPIYVSNNQLLRNTYTLDVWVDPKLNMGSHQIKQMQLSFQLASN